MFPRWSAGLRAMPFIATLLFGAGPAAAQATATLQLEAKTALGEVSGRIDHMAVDVKRQRLFVAELANNTDSR
jgi:hypothetical protein